MSRTIGTGVQQYAIQDCIFYAKMKCQFQGIDLTNYHSEFKKKERDVMNEIQVVYRRICHTIDKQDTHADFQI